MNDWTQPTLVRVVSRHLQGSLRPRGPVLLFGSLYGINRLNRCCRSSLGDEGSLNLGLSHISPLVSFLLSLCGRSMAGRGLST
jgi:hypothetical protein